MKVYFMLSLESFHRGDSNEYRQHTIINLKKVTRNYPKYMSAAVGFFVRTQEWAEIAVVNEPLNFYYINMFDP